MPWKEVSLMSQRYEFIQLALTESANISQLCLRFGISRKTAYKWINRFKNKGKSGLENLSSRPHHSPSQTQAKMVQAALNIRDKHPAWGGRKVKARLEHLGNKDVPSASTLTSIFKREDRIKQEQDSLQQTKPYIRFEHPQPNDLWQMDFKGHFKTLNQPCYPLTILDDHSRFNLCLAACSNERFLTVKQQLTHVFRNYGLPYRMTMDNGAPWGHDGADSFTQLTAWLIRLGIRVSHSRPYHPQTQGKDERFHRSFKAEVLAYQTFKDLKHCQRHFDDWRNVYNLERPHEALKMHPPVTRYQPSQRSFPEVLAPIEYGPADQVRQVYNGGFISFKNKEFRIGRAFVGSPVAIRETSEDGSFNVFFCSTKVKTINLNTT